MRSIYAKLNGGAYAKLQELDGLTIPQVYKLSWEQNREYLDLTELARLRWIEGWKIVKLADHFQLSIPALKERLRSIRLNPKRVQIDLRQAAIKAK